MALDRRSLLKSIGFAAAGHQACTAPSIRSNRKALPNILWLVADAVSGSELLQPHSPKETRKS